MTHSQTNTHKHYQQLSFSDRATIQALQAAGDTATVIAQKLDLFVKLSPMQKARIIKTMRAAGHTVGYMGDGINDTAALREADVSILKVAFNMKL